MLNTLNSEIWKKSKFSKSFRSYLGEDAAYNFINNMMEERKYYTDTMKKLFNKKLLMTKEDDEDF